MLLTLAALAVLSVVSAFWLRIAGFAIMMAVALLVLGFAFWNELTSFPRSAAYAFLALFVMQVGYFVGILLWSALPLKRKNRNSVIAKKFHLKVKW